MFTYTPNTYLPIPSSPPPSPDRSPNYAYLLRSHLFPRWQQEGDLTQSVCVLPLPESPPTAPFSDHRRPSFTDTVQVLPESSGGYRVLRPSASISSLQRAPSVVAETTQRRFSRHISSADMQQRMQERISGAASVRETTRNLRTLSLSYAPLRSSASAFGGSTLSLASARERGPQSTFHESLRPADTRSVSLPPGCNCQRFHAHTFQGRPSNRDRDREIQRVVTSLTSSTKAEDACEDTHDDLRNIFWTPSLSFHPYRHGDKQVDFSDLWPSLMELREHFQNAGIQQTVLRDLAVLDLCKIAITCGPIRLLRCIIELELVRVDQPLDNGSGMLHVAVLAHNADAVLYLTNNRISPKLRDRSGNTADQVCYSPSLKRQLPPRYQLRRSRAGGDGRMVVKPSLQDKDAIFKLAASPKYFDEIQKKLQSLDFNVNTECDTNGDFLLHIVCRRGLSQLPLIMALVKIQGADVELCNAEGVTPLMLAAADGNPVLCDVLMCLFGADPNKPSPNCGRCALHYAVEGNHRKSVECLIRRGADVNSEDHAGQRPDDVATGNNSDDCHEVIRFNRTRRMEALCDRIRKGELEKCHLLATDLFVVDDDGYTLVMTAAIYNKPGSLEVLLLCNDTTIDAQHVKTGMTALSIAAQLGNVEAVEILLSRGANPTISDMKSYMPLHYAVINNQERVVDSMLDYFPQCYAGLYMASRLCKRTSIHVKLKSAFTRRQEEIVTPKLLACAMSGAADELYQLLDDGDNTSPKSSAGNWPLYLAVENGHLDVVRLLMERGGDIRKRHQTTGETVLHIAAKMGQRDITMFLLNFCRPSHPPLPSGPARRLLDINTTDSNNRTALQIAAEKGFSRIVELLLERGATTALLDAGGQLITCPQFEGVRMQIESHRQRHTRQLTDLFADRSKKAFEQIQKIWLPQFDHNLRTRQGDTPLMAACALGKLQIVKFLLESAMYPAARNDPDSNDDSDADSGVLDPSGRNFQPHKIRSVDGAMDVLNTCVNPVCAGDELQASGAFTQSTEAQAAFVNSGDFTQSAEYLADGSEVGARGTRGGDVSAMSGNPSSSLQALLNDVNMPKGLYIFHDGLVSHVCAVSLGDGSTALHRAVEFGDSCPLVRVLLTADRACLNLQNDAGLSPLHTACRLGRKKVTELLLSMEGIDLNSRTLDSLLPEEMTGNKAIIRMVQKARLQLTGAATPPPRRFETDHKDDGSSTNSISNTGSTVNFDKVHSRYEALRTESKVVRAS